MHITESANGKDHTATDVGDCTIFQADSPRP